MIHPILQLMVEDINFDNLPSNWSMLDTASFSKSKKLWNFQQEALKNAIKVLYSYFKDNQADKLKFYQRYKLNGLDEDLEKNLDIKVSKVNRDVLSILPQYYPIEYDRIKFRNFINRAAFWMATGSGKTLLIVKLVEVLKKLMELGEIPKKDILILTYRDDLINQLRRHVNEFNELAIERGFRINLVELTEYDKVKRESLIPFFNEITVFYYRSDLISDEQKEKLIDFRNYENNGNWYIILDEAHKGDKEEAKRQMFYSIMSRNGFLFNFSATFIDPRDVVTTAYNFNLERFISEGYGKHIYILKQEIRAFKEKEDYNREEKQKIVLKSLILLTYLKKIKEKIKEIAENVYHEPLMLTLVNTVNLTEAKREKPDLTLFFEEIERIGKGDVDEEVFEKAKDELVQEFSGTPQLIYENISINIDENLIKNLKVKDVLKHVYNSESFGDIEAILIPGKRQEAVVKLKTSNKPFALIKIGDAIKWIKDNLKDKGYVVTEHYEDKSIFENLDEREDISILMGSRAFYEGWDSNRPNVILFINIGVGTEAKKFIIQSVGRGVRIEPIKGKRRRLKNLYNRGEDCGLFQKINKYVQPLETLFIFGTNRNALSEVIATLKVEREIKETIELRKNEGAERCTLLIPVFKVSKKKLYQEREPQKFLISESLFNVLREYFISTDDRILIIQNDLSPDLLTHIKNSFSDKEEYYKIISGDTNIPLKIATQKLITHFNLNIEELDKFKPLEDEIIHFKRIIVFLKTKEEIDELKEKISKVSEFKDPEVRKAELKSMLKRGIISLDEYTSEIEKLARASREESFKDLKIKNIVNHYYIPLILSEKEKVNYIKHVIKAKSEVKFIKDLETYLEKNKDKISVDCWMFSKIDEHLDEVYIPYYDPDSNKMRRFKPDFIFWFSKGKDYFIVFVDPKGIKHTEFEHKVDWFRKFFGDVDSPKVFEFDGFKIKVFLYLYTADKSRLSEGYRKYWFDKIDDIFKRIRDTISYS
ncbi:MAG: DEAD/DEAH box helicase family protein [Candidatus Odinarchaeota archaeon]|nr:DEAD/DEAH box helicase family protein [Candidatus Odinarchaeota archaeon]